MKKIVALILVLTLLGCVLCGCESEADKIAALSGSWKADRNYTADSVTSFLSGMDLYEEELALLDTGVMGYTEVVIFNADKTYTFTGDAKQSQALAEAYCRDDVFHVLYENRDQLSDVYGEDFSVMSEEEFQQFYAELYSQATFDDLISVFVGPESDYTYEDEDIETGTYRIDGNKIFCTEDGSSTEEYIEYELTGNTLTLKYTDATVTYTKAG